MSLTFYRIARLLQTKVITILGVQLMLPIDLANKISKIENPKKFETSVNYRSRSIFHSEGFSDFKLENKV